MQRDGAISIDSVGIDETERSSFMTLCEDIYSTICSGTSVNRFKLNQQFPMESYPLFCKALDVLLSNGSVCNGSSGFIAVEPPVFITGSDASPSDESLEDVYQDSDRRMGDLIQIETDLYRILSTPEFTQWHDTVLDAVESLPESKSRDVLYRHFKDGVFHSTSDGASHATDEEIARFASRFDFNTADLELYNQYELPSNLFTHMMNRSPSYLELMQYRFDPGFSKTFGIMLDDGDADSFGCRDPMTGETIDVPERIRTFLDRYLGEQGTSCKNVVSALLLIFNGESCNRQDLKSLCSGYVSIPHMNLMESRDYWDEVYDPFITTANYVKYLDSGSIDNLRVEMDSFEEVRYAVTVGKLFNRHKNDFIMNGVGNEDELRSFLMKYTKYSISDGRILLDNDVGGAFTDFIYAKQAFNKERAIKLYVRICGGSKNEVKTIADGIDFGTFRNDEEMSDAEFKAAEERLRGYQWTSTVNAESIFRDSLEIGDKFTDLNMHRLGFTKYLDVYFRSGYSSFQDCLLKNDFTGDDTYMDNRAFKIKLESSAFKTTLDNLQRGLQWVPVSESRMIYLRSERFLPLYESIRRCMPRVRSLCQEMFVTPYYLREMGVGEEIIDEDDYDLRFYDAILLACRTSCSSLDGKRFYHTPEISDTQSFECRAPEFLRYIVYESGGHLSIDEIQAILESKYGFSVGRPIIRSQIKLSSCIFIPETDSAYLDDDAFEEVLRNE